MVKEYLAKPQRLGPMASADFFVDTGQQTGGVGTNFIVEWVAEQPVYEPVVETLMLSNSGTQGLSFTSSGRVIKHIEISHWYFLHVTTKHYYQATGKKMRNAPEITPDRQRQ